MSDNQLDDLKQFIAASVSQSEERRRNETKQGFKAIRKEMADGFRGVGEAIDVIHKHIDELNATVNKRLTKLEQRIT